MGTVSIVSVSQVLGFSMALVEVVLIVVTLVMDVAWGQDYGPVNLDSVDPLSLSWNQIHWLVKDQIKEVEEVKAEHDELYNEITDLLSARLPGVGIARVRASSQTAALCMGRSLKSMKEDTSTAPNRSTGHSSPHKASSRHT